jgi:acetyl-CoA synthetase
VAPVRSQLPNLRHVLVTGDQPAPPSTSSLEPMLSAMDDHYQVPETRPDQPALLHFTSGTTGLPKGAVHVHEAVVAHHATARYALDLRAGDSYWCTADPGWVTGMSYGVIAPLTIGATVLVDSGEFDARRWYANLDRFGITVWYTAPTALRMLMRHGSDLAEGSDLSRLRLVASVGEPLNPEVVVWGERVLGRPVHDNWWQTETGAIMISNYAGMNVRPGSMGRPVPGVEVALVKRHDDGTIELIDRSDVEGEIALRTGWPSMFRGYVHDEDRYAKCFADGWYLSGDLARRDADGYYWFVGRADDVIKSAGHLIGPFEVESALMEHGAVAEAGVIGKPDPIAGEVVKAFVTLRPGFEPTDTLRMELLGFGRRRLGAVAPKEIAFDQNLPHTRSGKVMRRLLKARELGLPEGDTSTLESVS